MSYLRDVFAIRQFLAQRHFAVLLCTTVLLLKLLVPTGYMIGDDHGRVAITICPGTATATGAMTMSGTRDDVPDHGKSTKHGKPELPCAFAGLSAAMTGAIDPVRLAGPLAFVMAIGMVGVLLPTSFSPAYLRPPLRGPPVAR